LRTPLPSRRWDRSGRPASCLPRGGS
jgi:hypothetical protein